MRKLVEPGTRQINVMAGEEIREKLLVLSHYHHCSKAAVIKRLIDLAYGDIPANKLDVLVEAIRNLDEISIGGGL